MNNEVKWTLLRIDRGNVLPAALIERAHQNQWKSGWISAIGAVTDLELAYYNLDSKSYESLRLSEVVEVVSFSGNLTTVESEPFWHIHMIVADRTGKCIGGHLVTCTVALTLECLVLPSCNEISRELDPSLGLRLLKIM